MSNENVMYESQEESAFDTISHKWSNFMERIAEIVGFDADRYEHPKQNKD
tara:strand:+ start:65 stop:214 length:150 start_codon:yes stop_codon:yes gene_type:complete